MDKKELFITINADILTDFDLGKLIAFHKEHQPLVSMAVTQRKTSRYFLFDKNNRLCGWRNTATGEEKISIAKKGLKERAYSCVVVFDPKIFSLMTFTGEVFPGGCLPGIGIRAYHSWLRS